MSTVLEIESAIEQLPPGEKWNLIHRLHDALWQDWDKQIEADAAAGCLDHLVQEVETEIAAGRVKPLKAATRDLSDHLAALAEEGFAFEPLPQKKVPPGRF